DKGRCFDTIIGRGGPPAGRRSREGNRQWQEPAEAILKSPLRNGAERPPGLPLPGMPGNRSAPLEATGPRAVAHFGGGCVWRCCCCSACWEVLVCWCCSCIARCSFPS